MIRDQIFHLSSSFSPAGDQPQAIAQLVRGVEENEKNQVLLGVTGSGKTFTLAHVIANTQKPTLILAPNKTLAAQLYGEMKGFFPENAVEYFVSYYDYYQPEAYVPRTDTYIEKDSSINEQIDRLRHSATRALLERPDVIIVASVSCIYGIGAVESYSQMVLPFKIGQEYSRETVFKKLAQLQYKRNDMVLSRGNFRVKGDILEIFPTHYEDRAWRFSFWGDELESIWEVDPLTGQKVVSLDHVTVYPNSHYVIPGPTLQQAIIQIQCDLQQRLKEFEETGQLVEAQRLRERVTFDLEMMATTGTCTGIENYSRYMTGREPGQPPPTLFEYLPPNALFIVDESHVSVPQLGAMYKGDAARKRNLYEHGFRLPSCVDNRPLTFDEWDTIRPQTIFVSATPGSWELQQTKGIFIEQVIRPTGLIDPVCLVRPTANQVDDLICECQKVVSRGFRVLITTLTKKMAEALSEYLHEVGLKAQYLHSDVETLERIEIIQDLRSGVIDILIGINLLREGLDIPECALVAILDADKEGFLRSSVSLIQTIGRAARNVDGTAILYADTITGSMARALEETDRRRQKQLDYNHLHDITPRSVCKARNVRPEGSLMPIPHVREQLSPPSLPPLRTEKQKKAYMVQLEKTMLAAAANLDFEQAARVRDMLRAFQKKELLSVETGS